MGSPKILAIDDNPDNLTVLKAVLTDAFSQATVFTALNGYEGIKLALAEDPDVILLDIIMPGLDGFEVCRKLKAEERLEAIPVVFLTALKTDPKNRIRALEAGAEAFLSKPFDTQELMAQIRAMAKIKKVQQLQQLETEHLMELVAERTCELEKELSDRRDAEAKLYRANRDLRQNQIDMEKLVQDLKRENEARRESEERFQSISNAAQDAVIMMDERGGIAFWNDAAVRMFGYTATEAAGRNLHELIVPRCYHSLHHQGMKTFQSTGRGDAIGRLMELTALRKEGDEFPVELSLASVRLGERWHAVGIVRDITKRKQMEDNLLRAQRVECIGALAGGMAHDLNNILSPIMMATSMLREKIKHEVRDELISSIETAAQRGANIVGQVLTFARGVNVPRVCVRPELLFEEMEKIIQETFPKSIFLTVALPDQPWCVVGDSTQLHQVLLNLCLNARDAMPRGGSLVLSGENLELDDIQASMQAGMKAGKYVKFKVADSGTGIEPDKIGKIFDPFFTTKAPGSGTGLGLSSVMGIIRSHDGFVTVASRVNQGTTFEVFIPASNETAPAPKPSKACSPALGKGELILLIDDELPILKLTTSILKRNGYSVLTAGDGVEALARYSENSKEIRLVITDLMMPGMDGAGLVAAIRQKDRRIPIIITSGFGDADVHDELMGCGIHGLLRKPFNKDKLLQAIHEATHWV